MLEVSAFRHQLCPVWTVCDSFAAAQVLEKCADIQMHIAEGANSFLLTEYNYMAIFMVRLDAYRTAYARLSEGLHGFEKSVGKWSGRMHRTRAPVRESLRVEDIGTMAVGGRSMAAEAAVYLACQRFLTSPAYTKELASFLFLLQFVVQAAAPICVWRIESAAPEFLRGILGTGVRNIRARVVCIFRQERLRCWDHVCVRIFVCLRIV
jgi:hypothetical protein